MAAPLRLHWNEKGPLPLMPTAKVAVLPTFTVTAEGCVTMVGATAVGMPALTVSTATSLSSSPALLLTVTLYAPALALVTLVRRSTGLLAPTIAVPLKRH